MRKCIFILSRHKNIGIATIKTLYPSRGQNLELQIAEALGLEIKTVEDWITDINKKKNSRGLK